MSELRNIHEDTQIDPIELRQLIARMARNSGDQADRDPSVRDVAESMDVDVQTVISNLESLRREKAHNEPPPHVQKLGNMLEGMKTPVHQNRVEQGHRVLATTAIIFAMMLLLSWVFARYAYASRATIRKAASSSASPEVFSAEEYWKNIAEKRKATQRERP